MKSLLTLFSICILSSNSPAQIQSYFQNLKTSESGINTAEISLIQRSPSDNNETTELGSQITLIPGSINNLSLKMESLRFITHQGNPFILDNVTYIPVRVFYDNQTNDPSDDIHITSVLFPVNKELVLQDLANYEGEELMADSFKDAPAGKPTYKTVKLKTVKLE